MAKRPRRHFGKRIDFGSLICAPINEHGVVYLFGMIHDQMDFEIESVQAGFPDCIAQRQVAKDRWEEIRIEFESLSFHKHGHDSGGADVIVCWKHNWNDCPEHIEIMELSSLIELLELPPSPSHLSEYQIVLSEEKA